MDFINRVQESMTRVPRFLIYQVPLSVSLSLSLSVFLLIFKVVC